MWRLPQCHEGYFSDLQKNDHTERCKQVSPFYRGAMFLWRLLVMILSRIRAPPMRKNISLLSLCITNSSFKRDCILNVDAGVQHYIIGDQNRNVRRDWNNVGTAFLFSTKIRITFLCQAKTRITLGKKNPMVNNYQSHNSCINRNWSLNWCGKKLIIGQKQQKSVHFESVIMGRKYIYLIVIILYLFTFTHQKYRITLQQNLNI